MRPWVAAPAALLLVARGAAAVILPAGFGESTALSGLVGPTAVEFAADGRVFVAEKSGLIKVFHGLADPTPTIFADLRTNVHNYWDRGLLGLALHPAFPAMPYVYVLYTLDAAIGGTPPRWGTVGSTVDDCPTPPGGTQDGCVVAGRLSRLQAAGDVMSGTEQVFIEDWCQQFPSHSIGGLAFGADGALYVSGGDGASFTVVDYGQRGVPRNPCGDPPVPVGGTQAPPAAEGGALRSQDVRSAADPLGFDGTVLRLDPLTGAALPDNPLVGGSSTADDRIVAFGLRNPFRLAVRPGTSEVWVGDVGWDTWEEIGRIADPRARAWNFGWPCYEGVGRQPGYESTGLALCQSLYALGAGAVEAPFFTYAHAAQVVSGDACGTGTSAVSGLAFYAGGPYPPPYDGTLFFADYSRNCIWAMPRGSSGLPDPTRRFTFASGAPNPVALEIGPGGDLFYVDFNGGAVRRITYFPGNRPPTADARADVTSGDAPLTVRFDGSASSDPDVGDVLSYAWDLDADGAYDDASVVAPVHVYAAPGVYDVGLRVTDLDGASGTDTLRITVDNTPPVATIVAPTATTSWRVGEVVAFVGGATDVQDGVLAASALSWSLVLHHCPDGCHTHPVQAFPGVAGGSFTAPDHDLGFLEIRLTATDSGGLETTTSVVLEPQTVALTFVTDPPGLTLVVGSTAEVAPFARVVIVGAGTSISAPSPQAGWKFAEWSDGGGASHEVTATAAPTTYVASFVPACGDGVVDPGEGCDDGNTTGGDGCGPACACEATCGDGVVAGPCEQCDLEADNCAAGACCAAGCTSACRATGRCTGSGGCCVSAADCAGGEGCCGNGVVDAPGEACDDGNGLAGDCCTPACTVEAPGTCELQVCDARGPHLAAAVIERTTATDQDDDGTSERWRTRGRFTLGPGQRIAPEAEDVALVLSQAGSVLYAPTLPPGSFAAVSASCPRRWRFVDADAATPGAPGWRSTRLSQRRDAGGCSPTLDVVLRGGRAAPLVTPAPGLLRESLRVGNDCFTALLACTVSAGGRTRCAPAGP
jgi:cysteine-rich repeat protein